MANKYLDLEGLQAYHGLLKSNYYVDQIPTLVNKSGTEGSYTYTLNAEKLAGTTATDLILGNGVTATTQHSYDSTHSTLIATTGYVEAKVQGIANAMVFKGVADAEPTYNSQEAGWTYKVTTKITNLHVLNTAGTAVETTGVAEVGDTIIFTVSDDSTPLKYWSVIPSGDEPKGTVTDITIGGNGASAITKGVQTTGGVIPLDVNLAERVNDSGDQGADTSKFGVVKVAKDSVITLNSGILDIGVGSTSAKGVLQVGTNLSVTDGVVSVVTGGSSLGVVKNGTTVTIDDAEGHVGELKVASANGTTLGVCYADVNGGLTANAGALSITSIPTTVIDAIPTTGENSVASLFA